MKRNFAAVAAAFALCAAVLLGGCREGGRELSSGYSAGETEEERDVGERSDFGTFSFSDASVFSSGIVLSSSAESVRASTASSSELSSSSSSVSSILSSSVSSSVSVPDTASGYAPPAVIIASGQSSSAESSEQSSTAQVVTAVPEEPPASASTVEDIPNNDIPADPNEGLSSFEESSASLPEPSEPETSASPYDYEGTVYVAASGKGTKYHKNPGCSNMKGTLDMDVREALSKGYTPCKKCW